MAAAKLTVMGGFRVRRAVPEDVPAIASLHLSSYRAAYRGLLPADFLRSLDLAERERRWLSSIRDPARVTFVAESAGADAAQATGPIGLAEVGPARDADAPDGGGELYALHVSQACWRRGIGRSLHDHGLEVLAARGCPSATLWVLTGNAPARAFYQALGWNADGCERHRVLRGAAIDEVRYALPARANARRIRAATPAGSSCNCFQVNRTIS